MLRWTRNGQHGFSLLELVLVITVLGIMSTFIAVRWQSTGALTLANQVDLLTRNIRHAQSLAMGWEQPLRFSVAADSYAVVCVNSIGRLPCVTAGDVVTKPNGGAFSVALDNGVTLSGTSLDFDPFGRPNSGGSLLSTSQSFTLASGSETYSLTLSPVTGFVSGSSP